MAKTPAAKNVSSIRFSDFKLPQVLNETLADLRFEKPTPVQSEAMPFVLLGEDVLASAQTGTGKTAAFVIPLLAKMIEGWKKPVLIIAPTRELAEQIGKVLKEFTARTPEYRTAVIIGGLAYNAQIQALKNNPAFVVGTPGRLLDQYEMGHLPLKEFGALVIDEADRLLDMGFEPQINSLVAKLPKERQSLMFSATLPDSILRLANSYLRKPNRIAIGGSTQPVDRIDQDVLTILASAKDQTLIKEIDKVAGSIIVFARTKERTENVFNLLDEAGHDVVRIHGDRTQNQRSQAIEALRSEKARILVATDIAARGIDIDIIRHIINYDLPVAPEDYIHRIGRTARNGAKGHSIAFVTPEEMKLWARIYRMMYGEYPKDMLKMLKDHNAKQKRKQQQGKAGGAKFAKPGSGGGVRGGAGPSRKGASSARADRRRAAGKGTPKRK